MPVVLVLTPILPCSNNEALIKVQSLIPRMKLIQYSSDPYCHILTTFTLLILHSFSVGKYQILN
jgi:hypothetical protein